MDETALRQIARLRQPFYAYTASDYIAATSRGTSRRWLAGYRYRNASGELIARPPVTPKGEHDSTGGVSFLDLIEIAAIARLKGLGFSLPRIRSLVEVCRDMLNVENPLATLRFKTDGREIFVDQGDRLLDVSHHRRKGLQAWTAVLEPYLQTLDYEDEVVRRWWPMGRNEPVVVDPDYGWGFPVVAGSGIRTELVLEQFRVGEPIEEIADGFNLQPYQVERALKFEVERLAA